MILVWLLPPWPSPPPPVRQKGWVGDWNFGIPLHSRDHLSLSLSSPSITPTRLLIPRLSRSLSLSFTSLSRQNEYPVAKPSVYTTWQCCTLFVYVSRRASARHPSPLSDGGCNVATQNGTKLFQESKISNGVNNILTIKLKPHYLWNRYLCILMYNLCTKTQGIEFGNYQSFKYDFSGSSFP